MKKFLFLIILLFSCATVPQAHRIYAKEGNYEIITVCDLQRCRTYIVFDSGKMEELY